MTSKLEEYIKGSLVNLSLQNQHLSGAGATYEFEQKLKKYYSKKFVITFSNCTTALLSLCVSLNLKNKDIITSPLNWGGSISPFLLFDNKIIFSAVENISFNLDPLKLSTSLTPGTRAVLSVDYNGTPADSKSIRDFCHKNDLVYISDSAQSFGAFRDNKPAGFFADFIVLSFGPGKSLFGGEGGAILTDNESTYENIIWLTQHPLRHKKTFGPESFNEYSPINGRLNPLSAIMLNVLFYDYIKKIKTHQINSFEFMYLLNKNELIQLPKQLLKFNNSAYFKQQCSLLKNVKIKDVNNFLNKHSFKYQADRFVPNIIPLDKIFKKQFRNKFFSNNSLFKDIKCTEFVELKKRTMGI
ncbi:MAG: DegT/DnrJ/EryC1/StrS aminotransferase family protein [Ignavibacteria bacterium]|nr:DegT/DnrJ/EryC1/StrS aminotransferase family protein [Ignavibacteria bacterium]